MGRLEILSEESPGRDYDSWRFTGSTRSLACAPFRCIGWSMMFQGQRTKIRTYGRWKKKRENSQSGSEKLRGFRNPKDSS